MNLLTGQSNQPLTVSQFFQGLKQIVEKSYSNSVYLTGSITKFNRTKSKKGNEYITFTLQDATSKDEFNNIHCYWPSNKYNNARELPDNSSEVIIKGRPMLSHYGNAVQFTVHSLNLTGESRFLKKYNELKKQLISAELYNRTSRQPRTFLQRIAIIASIGSNGLQDLLKTLMPSQIPIKILDVPMGGTTVTAALVSKLKNIPESVDLVIIARGGGIENEDLLRFSSMPVAQAITETNVPVWTALGHTRDRFLIDYVADNCMPGDKNRKYFSSPSDAGQSITKWAKEAREKFFKCSLEIFQYLHNNLEHRKIRGEKLNVNIDRIRLAKEREIAKEKKQKIIIGASIIIFFLLAIIIWLVMQ